MSRDTDSGTEMLTEAGVYLAGAECSKIRPQFFADNEVDGNQTEHSSLAYTALSVVITLTVYHHTHTLSNARPSYHHNSTQLITQIRKTNFYCKSSTFCDPHHVIAH